MFLCRQFHHIIIVSFKKKSTLKTSIRHKSAKITNIYYYDYSRENFFNNYTYRKYNYQKTQSLIYRVELKIIYLINHLRANLL